MSNINVSLDNPYGEVTITRAKVRPSEDGSTVIANPMALSSDSHIILNIKIKMVY